MHPLVAPLVPAVQASGGITTWLPITISGLALLVSSTMSILSYLNSRWSYKLAKAKDHTERGPKWKCTLDEVDGHLRWVARMTDGPPRVYVYYRISGHFYAAKRDAPWFTGRTPVVVGQPGGMPKSGQP